jgi:hypothetical protein
MMLWVELGTAADVAWAQSKVTHHHYLHQPVDPRARPMVYRLKLNELDMGLIMAGIPHATKCGEWWGYPGLPTQWQVLDLCRIWLDPAVQAGGLFARSGLLPGFVDRKGVFRPTVASWFIGEVLRRIQRDRVALWPPVFLDQPYHIRLVISYHDPQYHKGTIYKAAGAEPVYTDGEGTAVAGPSGKYCWAWKLPEPDWAWQDIEILRPRTIRMFG